MIMITRKSKKSHSCSGSWIIVGLLAALLASAAMAQPQAGSPVGTQGKVASGAANAGNPVKVGCVYNSTLPSLTSGQVVDTQCDVNGSVRVNLVTSNFNSGFTGNTNTISYVGGSNVPAGSNLLASVDFINDGTQRDVAVGILGAVANGNAGTGTTAVEEAGRKYSHVNTATTTTSKTGAGFLHTFCNNTPVASASAVAYDNTAASGTVLFSITLPATLVGEGFNCATYDLAFTTGLTVVTTGTADWTWTFR